MENFQKKRKELVQKWNEKVLCHKPSKTRIRKYQRQLQLDRRELRQISKNNGEYVDCAIAQEQEVKKLKGEQDGLGDTPRVIG